MPRLRTLDRPAFFRQMWQLIDGNIDAIIFWSAVFWLLLVATGAVK